MQIIPSCLTCRAVLEGKAFVNCKVLHCKTGSTKADTRMGRESGCPFVRGGWALAARGEVQLVLYHHPLLLAPLDVYR